MCSQYRVKQAKFSNALFRRGIRPNDILTGVTPTVHEVLVLISCSWPMYKNKFCLVLRGRQFDILGGGGLGYFPEKILFLVLQEKIIWL